MQDLIRQRLNCHISLLQWSLLWQLMLQRSRCQRQYQILWRMVCRASWTLESLKLQTQALPPCQGSPSQMDKASFDSKACIHNTGQWGCIPTQSKYLTQCTAECSMFHISKSAFLVWWRFTSSMTFLASAATSGSVKHKEMTRHGRKRQKLESGRSTPRVRAGLAVYAIPLSSTPLSTRLLPKTIEFCLVRVAWRKWRHQLWSSP